MQFRCPYETNARERSTCTLIGPLDESFSSGQCTDDDDGIGYECGCTYVIIVYLYIHLYGSTRVRTGFPKIIFFFIIMHTICSHPQWRSLFIFFFVRACCSRRTDNKMAVRTMRSSLKFLREKKALKIHVVCNRGCGVKFVVGVQRLKVLPVEPTVRLRRSTFNEVGSKSWQKRGLCIDQVFDWKRILWRKLGNLLRNLWLLTDNQKQ